MKKLYDTVTVANGENTISTVEGWIKRSMRSSLKAALIESKENSERISISLALLELEKCNKEDDMINVIKKLSSKEIKCSNILECYI